MNANTGLITPNVFNWCQLVCAILVTDYHWGVPIHSSTRVYPSGVAHLAQDEPMEEVYRSICNTTQRTKTQLNSHCSDHYWYYWSLFWQHASIRFLSWLWFQEHSEWISTLLWMFRHVWRLASSQSGADAFSLIPINVHFGLIGWERDFFKG